MLQSSLKCCGFALIAIASIALGSCATSGVGYKSDITMLERLTDLLYQNVKIFLEEGGKCESKALAKAVGALHDMESKTNQLDYEIKKMQVMPAFYTNSQKRTTPMIRDAYVKGSLDATFAIAEPAGNLGCKALARRLYNHVTTRYVGLAYQSYRTQAILGLAKMK